MYNAASSHDASSTLAQRVAAAHDFFRPENLALLVIDVQKMFCDPQGARGTEHTAAISGHIQSIVPEFRKAGVPVVAVYYDTTHYHYDTIKYPPPFNPDFYKFTPEPDDTIVRKTKDSAFAGSNIQELLESEGITSLLVCGFNQAACIQDTVVDARKAGFEVCVLEDMSGNAEEKSYTTWAYKKMRDAGAIVASSQAVLQALRA